MRHPTGPLHLHFKGHLLPLTYERVQTKAGQRIDCYTTAAVLTPDEADAINSQRSAIIDFYGARVRVDNLMFYDGQTLYLSPIAVLLLSKQGKVVTERSTEAHRGPDRAPRQRLPEQRLPEQRLQHITTEQVNRHLMPNQHPLDQTRG